MFEVYRIETGRIFNVFSVSRGADTIHFLIFFEDNWVWVDGFYYRPVVSEAKGYYES